MREEWRGYARSAGLVALGGLLVFILMNLLPSRAPSVASRVRFGFAEPFALPISGPPTSIEKYKLSYSLAVRCNYTEVDALPYLFESISAQTILPDETVIVLTQTLEDGLGETLMNLAFGPPDARHKTGRGDTNVTQEQMNDMPAKDIAAKVKNATQPIELSVRLIPNLRFVMRAGHYPPEADSLFAISQTRNTTDLISVIDCNDYLHPQRTEFIAHAFAEKRGLEILSHFYRRVALSEWYKNGPRTSFAASVMDLRTSRNVSLAEVNEDSAAAKIIGWPSIRRTRVMADTNQLTNDKTPALLSEFDANNEAWEFGPTTLGLALNIHEL